MISAVNYLPRPVLKSEYHFPRGIPGHRSSHKGGGCWGDGGGIEFRSRASADAQPVTVEADS